MKRLVSLLLVFLLASLANAGVIDVLTDGIGDAGHAGTSMDPLVSGEKINLELVLRWVEDSFPGGGYPSYDGYLLSDMDLTLTCSTAATMGVGLDKKGDPEFILHPDGIWLPEIIDNVLHTWGSSIHDNIGIQNGLLAGGSDQSLIGGFYITANGTGNISLTWGLKSDPGQYADYTGDGYVPDPTWKDIGLGNLGGQTTIYAVPEPMTIALLGLGGLALLRRRK